MSDDGYRSDQQILRDDPFRTTSAARDASDRIDMQNYLYEQSRQSAGGTGSGTGSVPSGPPLTPGQAGAFWCLLLATAPGFLGGAMAAYYLRTQGFEGMPVIWTFAGAGLVSWLASAFVIYHAFRFLWALRLPLALAAGAALAYWFFTSPSTVLWRGPVLFNILLLAALGLVLKALGLLWRKSKLISILLLAAALAGAYFSQPPAATPDPAQKVPAATSKKSSPKA